MVFRGGKRMTIAYILLGLAFVAVFLLGYNLRAHNEEERKMYIARKRAYKKVMTEKTRRKLNDALDDYEQNYNELY